MVVVDNFEVPKSAQELPLADAPDATFLIFFSASNDPETNQPWCSDARAAIPVVDKTFFMPSSPTVHYAYVGVKNEYKGVPTNRFRTDWNIQCIPALVRYARVGGKVVEVGRLVEGELLDEKRIHDLIGS